MKLTVKIPATSANLGSGFDCMGVALNIYNTIVVEEKGQGLKIDILDETRDFLPQDSRNLVYRSMQKVFELARYRSKGLHITLVNQIPVTRGLGSSSASVVGGLLAANKICGDILSLDELMVLAAEIEGHPDNATPAITGGLAIVVKRDKIYYEKIEINPEKLSFALFIPEFILRTQKARNVLPKAVPHRDAVFNVGRAAMLTAAFITEDYDKLKIALEDKLHQQYRKKLIYDMESVFEMSDETGALGSYISGAGPTIVSIIKKEQEQKFQQNMQEFLYQYMPKWRLQIAAPDNQGARIIQE